MKMKRVLSAGFGMIALGLAATAAQAAPLAGPGSVAQPQAGRANLVEKTTFYGHYHYGYYPRYRYYKPYGYHYKPYYYGYYKPYYRRHYRHYHHW